MTGKRCFWPDVTLVATGATLIAFALRVYLLDGQSLWGDEAISLGRAMGTLSDIAADARHEGTLPPLYYYALHFWIQCAGASEFALRFLSVLQGTAVVALLFAAVRVSGGTSAAATAALLAAIAPFLIYYSQETRMYAQAAMLTMASTALFLRQTTRDSPASPAAQVAYVAISTAAVLTHYFAGFVLLAQNAAMAMILVGRIVASVRAPITTPRGASSPARALAGWSLSQIAILALIAPWVVYVRQSLAVTAGAVSRQAISLEEIAASLLRVFSVGASMEAGQAAGVGLVFAFLAIAALVLRPQSAAFWVAALMVPVAATFYVSFTPQVGWPRYFIAAAPAWLALAGMGLSAMLQPQRVAQGRRSTLAASALLLIAGLAAAMIIVAGSAVSLRGYFTDPRYARPDWRGALADLAAESLPSTALVVSGPTWLPELEYYYRGFPDRFDLPVTSPANWPAAERKLAGIAAGRSGIWFLKYYPPNQDADALTEQWLANHAFRVSGRWVENATFSYYSLPAASSGLSYKPGVTFGGLIQLTRLTIVKSPDRDSSILQLALEWKALHVPQADYSVFAHVVDELGSMVGQRDSPPVNGFRPTSSWQVGDEVTDRIGIRVPVGPFAAPLRIRIGLYDPADGTRLLVTGPTGESLGDNYYAEAP